MSINKYSIILSPITAGSTYLKNRMIHPNASPHFLQGPEEYPADAYIAHYSGIARSGAAIVTMAEWDNWPEQRTAPAPTPDFVHMQAFNVKSGGVQNYICAMLEDIHFYGSKALIALEPQVKRDKQASHPAGAQVPGFDDIPDLSKGLSHAPKRRIIAMTPAQEEESINEFIDKIAFYHDLGYDGISVRVDKFIRKASNPERTLEQRCAFFVNALKRAREVFGKHFIIDLTVQGQEPLGYDGRIAPGEGYSVEDMISVCRMVEGTVDIITLRGKDVAAAHPLPCHFKKGCQETLEYARALKNAGIRAIVAVNGGYQDPDDIERELEAGTFDMVSMARTFICENEYEKKLREDRAEDIVPCLWCNLCHGNFHTPWISVCSVNPKMGMGHKINRMLESSPARKKRVCVIGGGPAGMRAAVYAAERGHDVTLFEKTDYLGGQLLHAESFSFKWSLKDYRDWLVRQMEKHGVDIRMCTEPSPDDIRNEGYDAVIAACGAAFNLPSDIEGLKDEQGNALYPTIADVFGKESELGKNVIIAGGSEAGVETAMYLAENGHDVTVLTRQDELAKDASHLHSVTTVHMRVLEDGLAHLIPQWEAYDNIRGILEVTTKKVDGNTVTYADKDGAWHTISGDSIVICGGTSPRLKEALEYSGCAPQFMVIGDADSAGKLWRCSRQAYSAAYML